jgi:hypothetical protein
MRQDHKKNSHQPRCYIQGHNGIFHPPRRNRAIRTTNSVDKRQGEGFHISRDVIFKDTTVSSTHLEETEPSEPPTPSINDKEKDQIEQPKTTKRSSPRQHQPKRLFPMEQGSYDTKKRKE